MRLDLFALSGPLVKDEPVSVRREDEGNVESLGVAERLLHAIADAVVVVLGLNDG